MPRATICIDAVEPDRAIVAAWVDRWRDRAAFLSDNEGCGCCVDSYRVEVAAEALDELPPHVFTCSEWSPLFGATNPVMLSTAAKSLGGLADPERVAWFIKGAPREFVDQDVGQLRTLYQDGDELWTFRTAKRAGGWEGYALVRRGKVVGAAIGKQS